MWLYATGGASLGGQTVKCECDQQRSLATIMNVHDQGERTDLTNNLAEGEEYVCHGHTPWLGITIPEGQCGRPLRGSLRSAANVYFPQQRGAIYLPRKGGTASSDLVSLLEHPPLSTLIQLLRGAGAIVEPKNLRQQYSQHLTSYSDAEVRDGIATITSEKPTKVQAVPDEDPEVTFRRPEYEAIRRPRREAELLIRSADLSAYDYGIIRYFSRLTLLDKLKETRAFTGFTRVLAETSESRDIQWDMLWRTPPVDERWLPAYVVHGEGIYLELDHQQMHTWEGRNDVTDRVRSLLERYERVRGRRGLRDRLPSPRLLLLHTFSHLLMLQLAFECGYGTASLRERLYVSTDPHQPMAGILIYTAAGDSDGTMGGLVRMGRPGSLEPVIRRAIEGASWCSADPICMEVAAHGGQGPDSLNLAACHGCALVPETACELFNRFLDRGLLVGDHSQDNADLGFFRSLVTVS